IGTSLGLALAKNPDPVLNRAVAEAVYPQGGLNPVGIGNGPAIAASGLYHKPDDRCLVDVQAAFLDHVQVDRGVEVGEVGDGIDVPVDVVVDPAGGNGLEDEVVIQSGVGAFSHGSPVIDSERSAGGPVHGQGVLFGQFPRDIDQQAP